MDKSIEFLNKLKLAFPIFMLVLIILLLILNLINIRYLEKESLSKLERRIILATKVSKLLHETQKERGMSVGYLSNSAENFGEELKLQKPLTDQMLNKMQEYCVGPSMDSYNYLENTLKSLRDLAKIRSLVEQHHISAKDASSFYTHINNSLLDTVLSITKTSQSTTITNNAMAYVNLLFYEENLGLERAVGTNILLHDELKQPTINLFNSYIVKQNTYKELFLKYASNHSKGFYDQHFQAAPVAEVAQMRSMILSVNREAIAKIDPYYWFKSMTKTLDILQEIDSHLSKTIIDNIQNEYNISKRSLFRYIILGIILFLVFILMIIMILQLQKNEKKLKNLLNSYVISSTTDLNGVITGVSQAFCEISGYTEEELIGKPHRIVRHPDIPSELYKNMWQTIKNGNIWQGEVKNRRKDGSYYWVTAVISPLYDSGHKIGYNSVRQDITDSKRIEELNKTLEDKISIEVAKSRQKDQQMIQQSRLAQMGEMISMIAHQWRQPLTAISATSATINLTAKSGTIESDFVIERANRISEYASHLSATIDDFREFFKPDKEKKEITFDELIRSVFGIVEVSLSQQNISLERSLEYHDRFVSYPNELKQVILNLIKNAEDVLIEKNIVNPYIKLASFKKDGHAILEVSDNGLGIDQNIIDKIFDPYFSTKLKKNGTGLGLYMSKTIIEEHCGGKLYVKNLKDGALFSIVLPI